MIAVRALAGHEQPTSSSSSCWQIPSHHSASHHSASRSNLEIHIVVEHFQVVRPTANTKLWLFQRHRGIR